MDFAIANRFKLSHDLVQFSREAFEADLSSFPPVCNSEFQEAEKTTDDIWADLMEELNLNFKNGKFNTHFVSA